MYKVEFKNNSAYIKGLEHFDLANTLDCGQAFRWSVNDNNIWSGIVSGIYLELEKKSDGTIILYNTNEEIFNSIWKDYFDLERDYDTIISSVQNNDILKTAAEFGKGIRVLNQEPWETLC
ncbi:MAG: 8-oxoguanine DNA glycosylase, N-terminal domain-containing protein, partial [Clostridia bacterium]|nr:8-oxoguanine DNA glycosylase, N-terminal domain-containing protein [Clostridia bacterium]